jgi:PadR family transcriptional regulator PadR
MCAPARQISIQRDAIYRTALHGLAKVLVLHLASKGPVYGWGLRKSLHAVGCTISSGTLYPLVRGLEADGLMRSTSRPVGKRTVCYYELTAEGRLRLAALRCELLRVMRDTGLYPDGPRRVLAFGRRRRHGGDRK